MSRSQRSSPHQTTVCTVWLEKWCFARLLDWADRSGWRRSRRDSWRWAAEKIRGDGPRRGRLQRAPSAAPAQIGLLARSSGQHQAPDRWARSEVCAVGYLMALPFPSSRCSSVTTVSSKPLAEAKHHSFSSQVISLFSVKEVISGEDIRQRLGQQPPRMGRRTRPQTLGSPELMLVSGRPELSLAPGSQAGAILSDDRCAAFFLLLLLDRSALRSSHRFIVCHYVTGGPSCPSL